MSPSNTTLRAIQNLRILLLIPTSLIWFVRDVPLVYSVHLSLDPRRFSGNEQKPRQCCRFDLIFAAVLSGEVRHTRSEIQITIFK